MNSVTSLTLLEQIASADFLHNAWLKLNKTNKGSSGLSNETIQIFSSNLATNLSIISKQLRENKYQFSKVKAVTLRKKNSKPQNEDEKIKYRPLRIAEVRDRVVQKAITQKLDEILTDKFQLDNECSFAYRKGKNVEEAIDKMKEYYDLGYRYILEADIVKFFDNVDKPSLIGKIKEVLPDTTIDSLFEAALNQEIGNANDFEHSILNEYFFVSENGIPQGNPLSPLLANVYLAGFDQSIILEGYKMIRYADDFIIMCKTRGDAENALELSKSILEKELKLEIHELADSSDSNAKTRIVNPQMHKFSFLSIRFDGTRCWVKDEKFLAIRDRIKEITNPKESQSPVNLLDTLKSLKNTIEGWVAAYHFVDLESHLLELDKLINRQLYLFIVSIGLNVKKEATEKISFKGKSNIVIALKNHQRFNLGIDSCIYIWNRVKKN